MLEWYSDTVAVEKMLGEMYDKMKRPTKKQYYRRCEKHFLEVMERVLDQGKMDTIKEKTLMISYMIIDIYEKYLSDSNGCDSAKTVSDIDSLSLIESMKSMEDWFKIIYFAKWSKYMIERLPTADGGVYRTPIWDYILISE